MEILIEVKLIYIEKKMISNKKRKILPTNEMFVGNPIDPPSLKTIPMTPKENVDVTLPYFPSYKTISPVVSPQLMYQILYSDLKEFKPFIPEIISNKIPQQTSPILHSIKLEPQISKPFWNLDAHPNNISNWENKVLHKEEPISDEKWLDSVFSEVQTLPSTVSDISALLELPTFSEIPDVPMIPPYSL